MKTDRVLRTFIFESRELLTAMDDALLGIERVDDLAKSVNSIFRAAHTIKGSAGLFNLDYRVAFTHVLAVDTDCRRISLRFGPNVLRHCLAPLSFIRHLEVPGTGETGCFWET
jgi:two-component system chemotaxis sensor kinase CheA